MTLNGMKEDEMKALREVKMEVTRYEIGDRIKVRFASEAHYATAIFQDRGCMMFLMDECLNEARPMNEGGGIEGGYDASDLRKWLAEKADEIPKKLHKRMIPFKNGDYLGLLSGAAVFGDAEGFKFGGNPIPWFRDKKHRVGFRKNRAESWWLRDVVSAAAFANVDNYGGVYGGSASRSFGVRPAFRISHFATCPNADSHRKRKEAGRSAGAYADQPTLSCGA